MKKDIENQINEFLINFFVGFTFILVSNLMIFSVILFLVRLAHDRSR